MMFLTHSIIPSNSGIRTLIYHFNIFPTTQLFDDGIILRQIALDVAGELELLVKHCDLLNFR